MLCPGIDGFVGGSVLLDPFSLRRGRLACSIHRRPREDSARSLSVLSSSGHLNMLV